MVWRHTDDEGFSQEWLIIGECGGKAVFFEGVFLKKSAFSLQVTVLLVTHFEFILFIINKIIIQKCVSWRL